MYPEDEQDRKPRYIIDNNINTKIDTLLMLFGLKQQLQLFLCFS